MGLTTRSPFFVTETTDTERIYASRRKEDFGEDRPLRTLSGSRQQSEGSRSNSRALVDLAAMESETSILEHAVSTSLKKESKNGGSQTTEGLLEKEDDQDEVLRLGRTIEMLLDLLPTIRRIRRTQLLRQEPRDSEKATVVVQESSSMTSATDDPAATSDAGPTISLGLTFDQLLNHSLDLASSLETVLRNDENWAKKNGEKVEAYSGVLRKETDRLRDFKRVKEGKGDSADMQQVISTIATLGKALNDTIKDIAVSEKPKTSEKQRSMFHLIDAKSADDRDETIKALVKMFGIYNAKMWEQSASVPVAKLTKTLIK